MAKVVAMIGSFVVSACDHPQAARSDEQPNSRWQIVSVPAGSKVPGMEFGMSPPAVWRLDTQTGKLEFCYQDGGIKCGLPDSPHL